MKLLTGDTLHFENLPPDHIRHYRIAGLTIKVQASLPITESTFHPKFTGFESPAPGAPAITLSHHFYLPEINPSQLGRKIYQSPPWVIHRQEQSWLYLWLLKGESESSVYKIGRFSPDHTRGEIFSSGPEVFNRGNLTSLSLFPTDQIILARVLADHQGCFLHAAGMALSGQGILFAGHSEAGKSTVIKLLREAGETLCDDRMIIRCHPEGFRIHGTWSHGEIPRVSPISAPFKALLFLEQSPDNRLIPIRDRSEIIRRLLLLVIKPLATPDWWEKTFALFEKMVHHVPCYVLRFDKSGRARAVITELLRA